MEKITNEILIDEAMKCGFDLVGFAKAGELTPESVNLKKWLDMKFQAGMTYMERNLDKRENVKNILPSAKSIISFGVNYYSDEKYLEDTGYGKISRYAWGKDYHIVIGHSLVRLTEKLKSIDPEFEAKSYVDTGPVMDKAWAVRAGLGWLGKHTNVISKKFGSWFFIATIICNYEFDYDNTIPDFCGTCTSCISACPTNAITDAYVVDSNRCISYLTIENKGAIPDELQGKFENWLFGCDICQDVCPWNKKFHKEIKFNEFRSNGNKEIELSIVENMSEEDFDRRFSVSSVKRAKLKGLKRNAQFLNPTIRK